MERVFMDRFKKYGNKRRKLYSELSFFTKLILFFKEKISDLIHYLKYGRSFAEYGLTMYCGRQGGGKTVAMTEYLERMRKKFPKVKIVTNYGYLQEDFPMNSWEDIFTIRNGEDGVIFAIDEIQNEYNSNDWKNFPEGLLSEITQQRKQKIKIVATSQVFTRVAKPLREQTFEVVECVTIAGRWTFTKAFDASDYNHVIENPEKKAKLRRLYRRNFVQDRRIREVFDSYAKIERMAKAGAIPREVR